jgi:hypothetical protein
MPVHPTYTERDIEVDLSFSEEEGKLWRNMSSTTTFWAKTLELVRVAKSAGGKLTKQLLSVGKRAICAGEACCFFDGAIL